MFARHWKYYVLVARVIIGGIFIFAGWAKHTDMTATVTFFGQIGFAPFLAYFVTYAEIIGGIMLVIGLYAEYVAALLAVIMLVAIWKTYPLGLAVYEAPLGIFAALLMLMTTVGALAVGSPKFWKRQ